jgi:hypothetical protein
VDNCRGILESTIPAFVWDDEEKTEYRISGLKFISGPSRYEASTGCGRNNSHISKRDYKQMARDITKNFLFPKCRYQKVFLF